MTEYATSPGKIQEFVTSKERTAYWVHKHTPSHTEFLSPSIPPSVLDDPEVLPYENSDSDAESTHSLPPKMILKYGDGSIIPISHWHYEGDGTTRQIPPKYPTNTTGLTRDRSVNNRSRSKSGSNTGRPTENPSSRPTEPLLHMPPSHSSQNSTMYAASHTPEEIRVLPSQGRDPPQSSPQKSRSNRSNSQSTPPRSPDGALRSMTRPTTQPSQSHALASASSYVFVPSGVSPSRVPISPSQPQSAPSQPTMTSQTAQRLGSRSPPAIVYAPSHHHRANYAPPTIFSSHNAPGMKYSQSAPTRSSRSQYPRAGTNSYPPNQASQLAPLDEEIRQSRSRTPGGQSRPSSRGRDSVSTYYVLPTPGQKVQIITPEGNGSLHTATSTTKSPSPTSPTGSLKKPFFQRLFSFVSSTDSKGSHGRRLQRRHSTGGSGRSRPPIPGRLITQ